MGKDNIVLTWISTYWHWTVFLRHLFLVGMYIYVTEILDVNMPFDKMQRSPQHNQKESLYLLKCIKDHQKGSYFWHPVYFWMVIKYPIDSTGTFILSVCARLAALGQSSLSMYLYVTDQTANIQKKLRVPM